MAIRYADAAAIADTGDGTTTNPSDAVHGPYKTINHALHGSNHISSGDTLKIHTGTYSGENTAGSGWLEFDDQNSVTNFTRYDNDTENPVIIGLGFSAGGSETHNVYIGYPTVPDAKMTFTNITFQAPSEGAKDQAVTLVSGGVTFTNCVFTAVPTVAGMDSLLLNSASTAMAPITFTGCTFNATTPTATNQKAHGAIIPPGSGKITNLVTFSGCTISVPGNCFWLVPSVQGDLRNVTITDCTATTLQALGYTVPSCYALNVNRVNRTSTADTLTISGSTFSSPTQAAQFISTQGIAISNCTFIASNTVVVFGSEQIGLTGTVSGTMSNCVVKAIGNSLGHGVLIGYTANSVAVDHLYCTAYDDAVVLKNCTNCSVTNSLCYCSLSSSGGTIYMKGCNGCSFTNSLVAVTGMAALQVSEGAEHDKATNNIFTGNTIVVAGTGFAYDVAPLGFSTDLSGTLNVNNNKFYFLGATTDYGTLGTSQTHIATFPSLRTAWGALDSSLNGNDLGSKNLADSGSSVVK